MLERTCTVSGFHNIPILSPREGAEVRVGSVAPGAGLWILPSSRPCAKLCAMFAFICAEMKAKEMGAACLHACNGTP